MGTLKIQVSEVSVKMSMKDKVGQVDRRFALFKSANGLLKKSICPTLGKT